MEKEIEKKADKEAFEHTVFMALADIYSQLNPKADIGHFLNQLKENKAKEKNRIINEFIRKTT